MNSIRPVIITLIILCGKEFLTEASSKSGSSVPKSWKLEMGAQQISADGKIIHSKITNSGHAISKGLKTRLKNRLSSMGTAGRAILKSRFSALSSKAVSAKVSDMKEKAGGIVRKSVKDISDAKNDFSGKLASFKKEGRTAIKSDVGSASKIFRGFAKKRLSRLEDGIIPGGKLLTGALKSKPKKDKKYDKDEEVMEVSESRLRPMRSVMGPGLMGGHYGSPYGRVTRFRRIRHRVLPVRSGELGGVFVPRNVISHSYRHRPPVIVEEVHTLVPRNYPVRNSARSYGGYPISRFIHYDQRYGRPMSVVSNFVTRGGRLIKETNEAETKKEGSFKVKKSAEKLSKHRATESKKVSPIRIYSDSKSGDSKSESPEKNSEIKHAIALLEAGKALIARAQSGAPGTGGIEVKEEVKITRPGKPDVHLTGTDLKDTLNKPEEAYKAQPLRVKSANVYQKENFGLERRLSIPESLVKQDLIPKIPIGIPRETEKKEVTETKDKEKPEKIFSIMDSAFKGKDPTEIIEKKIMPGLPEDIIKQGDKLLSNAGIKEKLKNGEVFSAFNNFGNKEPINLVEKGLKGPLLESGILSDTSGEKPKTSIKEISSHVSPIIPPEPKKITEKQVSNHVVQKRDLVIPQTKSKEKLKACYNHDKTSRDLLEMCMEYCNKSPIYTKVTENSKDSDMTDDTKVKACQAVALMESHQSAKLLSECKRYAIQTCDAEEEASSIEGEIQAYEELLDALKNRKVYNMKEIGKLESETEKLSAAVKNLKEKSVEFEKRAGKKLENYQKQFVRSEKDKKH